VGFSEAWRRLLMTPDFMMRKGVSGMVRTRPWFLATTGSIARRFGYPLAGCSPALPASVSPKSFRLYDLGGRLLGGMRMGCWGSLLWL
jgi:hypothetical protein